MLVDPIAVDDDKQPIKINKEVDLTRVNVQYNATVNREYVWDVTDTDRLLCQYSSNGTPFFVATNESWTPVAQLDAAGHVTDQFSFDPYGTLLSYDGTSYDRPMLEVGHQGLFFDRLDVPLLNSDGSENPRLAANAAGLYYNRARTYSPSLGRFLQADPNATGMAMGAPRSSGLPVSFGVLTVAPRSMYGDGLSLYAYVHSCPIGWGDPSGLIEFTLGGALKAGGIGAALNGVSSGVYHSFYGQKNGQSATVASTASAVGKGALAGFVGGFIGYSFGAAYASALALEQGGLGLVS